MHIRTVGALALAAFALNVDQNRQVPTRLLITQQVHYYRLTVNFNDPRISTAQKFGRLPSNAFINRVACHVTTAFNASTVGLSTTVLTGTVPKRFSWPAM